MAVAFDAKMTAGNGSGGTYAEKSTGKTISSTGMTVGASATCLIGLLTLDTNGGGDPGVPAMTWNSVSMTAGPTIFVTSDIRVAIFALVNPTTGNHTQTATWPTLNAQSYMSAISFKGTDTVTGIKAADSQTASNVASITVPSDVNGATVAIYENDTANTGTPNFTVIFAATDLLGNAYANYTLGGTSNTHTFVLAVTSALAGVHVIAPAAGATTLYSISLLGAGPA